MGNQQERLAWLAGIIDGEGTVSIQCYTKPDKTIRLTPYIAITNSNQPLLDECISILSEVAGKAAARMCGKTRSKLARVDCSAIRVDGYPAVYKVLASVAPHLVGKLPQTEIVLGFIESRADNLLERDKAGRVKRVGYSQDEVESVFKLRKLHRRESPETIRSAPNVIR